MIETTHWHSWQLHVHTVAPEVLDDVVVHCVEPVVRAVAPTRWFYIRYWQGGPHVRLRIADLDAEAAAAVGVALGSALAELHPVPEEGFDPHEYGRQAAGFAAAGETGEAMDVEALRAPGVYATQYEAEYDRYGGVEYMSMSEQLFHVSSEVALAVCRQRPRRGQAIGDGLLAMAAGLSILPDAERRRFFLLRLRTAWTSWGLAALPGYDPDRVDALARTHADRLRPAAARLRDMVQAPSAGWSRWTEPLAGAVRVWAGADNDERRAGSILSSHVHMMENRLGVGGGREGYLATVLLELLEI